MVLIYRFGTIGWKHHQLYVGPLPGEVVLNRYRIDGKIGEGTNGITYRGVDTETGQAVAVKQLKLKNLKNWKQFDLFEREAQTLKALNHPGIPKYINYSNTGRQVLLIQALVDSPNLRQVVQEGVRFDDEEIEHIARDLLDILNYLCTRRPPVIHRDIKPENVILERSGSKSQTFLVDFGGVQEAIASSDGAEAIPGSTIIGTAGYMPPEQFQGAATPASDMYALGGVLLFLVSGKAPGQFPSERLRIAYEREVQVPERFSNLLKSLLSPFPEDRPNAAQAIQILDGTYTPVSSNSSSAFLPRRDRTSLAMPPRQRLSRPWKSIDVSQTPRNSRVVVTSDSDMLMLEIPPAGLTGSTLPELGFGLTWNILVGMWTAGALASGGILFSLFSIPFWWVGIRTVKSSFLAAVVKETLRISAKDWDFSQALARFSGSVAKFLENDTKTLDGSTSELRGAKVVLTMINNGRPVTAIEVVTTGREQLLFGETLSLAEQEYCVALINRHIERVYGPVDTENDLYLPAQPFDPDAVWSSRASFSRQPSFRRSFFDDD